MFNVGLSVRVIRLNFTNRREEYLDLCTFGHFGIMGHFILNRRFAGSSSLERRIASETFLLGRHRQSFTFEHGLIIQPSMPNA